MTVIENPVVRAEKVFASTNKESVPAELNANAPWKNYEKVLFRFFFIYFSLFIVPLDWNFYQELFARDWSSFHFSNLFYIARYTPRFFADVPVFADWLVVFGVALAGTFVWGVIEAERKDYNRLYYLLRVAVRYRLAVALLAYGFIKLFPQQMPLPSISNLNTSYGDLEAWKIFSMSTGIVPGYQSFLGLIEVVAALLLLDRKTATIGAFIVLPFTGNVVLSNLAYEGGEYVYGSLLVSFALFVVAYDVIRLYQFGAEQTVLPPSYRPDFPRVWQRSARFALKVSFVLVFVFVYAFQSYKSYAGGGYHYKTTAGIPGAEGLYNVKEFIVNGESIPPSRTHQNRWRDVVFEKWATLSIRSNEPVEVKSALSEEIFTTDDQKNYEYAGNAGRQFYSYTYNPIAKELIAVSSTDPQDKIEFSFDQEDGNTIRLKGRDAKGNFKEIVLEKLDKKYLLEEAAKNGRRRGLKL